MPEPGEIMNPLQLPNRCLSRLRVSLRTLVFLVLLVGSAGLFYIHIDPWFVWRTLPALPGQMGGFISPDGYYYGVAAWRDVEPPDSHKILVWEMTSGMQVYTHEYGATERAWGASFASFSGYLLLYENAGEHLIDLKSGHELSAAFDRVSFYGERNARALLFKNEADSEDAELWDLANRQCIKRMKVSSLLEKAYVNHAQNRILFTRREPTNNHPDKRSSLIFDIERGTRMYSVPGASTSVGFSPDDKFVLTYDFPHDSPLSAEGSNSYFVSESATGKLVYSFRELNDPEFSPDGTLLLRDGSSEDESILLNLANGSEHRLKGRQVLHRTAINKTLSCFSPDAREVFTTTLPTSSVVEGKDSAILAWDCISGENLFSVATSRNASVEVYSDSQRILTGEHIFDPQKKKIVADYSDGQMASDHRRLLVSGYAYNNKRKSPIVLDSLTGNKLFQFPDSASGNMCEMDGECLYVLTNAPNNEVFLWHRRRPEYWWGIAWLPEFWILVLFALSLPWTIWLDSRKGNKR